MKIWTVNAFMAKPFLGNPAAVCVEEGGLLLELKGDRVLLTRQAVTVLAGNLIV